MIVIFSGYNQRAVVAFLRTLKASSIDFAIIASSKEDDILLSSYREDVLAIRSLKALDLKDILSCLEQVKNKLGTKKDLLIAPSTEALNRFLIEQKEVLENNGCIIPLVANDLYEKISDKEKFAEACASLNIDVPRYDFNVSQAKLPLVAKPKVYMNKKGETPSPVIIDSEEDKGQFLQNYDPEEFFYQNYIPGRSLYLLYYFHQDGSCDSYSQENFIQQAGGKSIVAAKSSNIHLGEVSKSYEELFKTLEFRGLVMVEIKEHMGKYYMIEANPRFWGPSQLFVDAGNNLFDSFLFDYGQLKGKPKIKESSTETRYYWHGGIVSDLKENRQLTFHNYSKSEYEREITSWKAADVYNREDTQAIYLKEINS